MEVIVSDIALIAPTKWRKPSDWNYTKVSSSARGRDTAPQAEAATASHLVASAIRDIVNEKRDTAINSRRLQLTSLGMM